MRELPFLSKKLPGSEQPDRELASKNKFIIGIVFGFQGSGIH